MLSRRSAACVLCLAALAPTGRTLAAAGAPLLLEVSDLAPGRWLQAVADGVAICVRRRTDAEVWEARSVAWDRLPHPEPDEARVSDPEWLVVDLVCSHGGCRPIPGLGPFRGWLCPCHGSAFDLSGRVRRGPAKRNLQSRRYRLEEGRLLVLPASTPPSGAEA